MQDRSKRSPKTTPNHQMTPAVRRGLKKKHQVKQRQHHANSTSDKHHECEREPREEKRKRKPSGNTEYIGANDDDARNRSPVIHP